MMDLTLFGEYDNATDNSALDLSDVFLQRWRHLGFYKPH